MILGLSVSKKDATEDFLKDEIVLVAFSIR